MQYYKPRDLKPGYEKYRRVLVDWMCEIGDTIKQAYTTIHHAVSVMDTYFVKQPDIESNNRGKRLLKLVALTSIFISAKYWEKDSRGPTARNISMLTRGEFTENEILHYERKILMEINWNLMFSTPADFVSLFLNQGIIYSDDLVASSKNSEYGKSPTLKNVKYVRKYWEFFVDLWLQEHTFQKYSCIILAIAIIIAARKSVNIVPIWNDDFDRLFMMNFKHIEKCYLEIYKFYECSFPSHANETIRQTKIVSKAKHTKKTNSVKTRYTSSDTTNKNSSSTNRNSSSTKSSRRSNNVPKILKQNDRSSNNNSLVRDIKTPDKFFPLYQKSSSSTKKSTVKSFRPGTSNLRQPLPAGMHDSSSKKRIYPNLNSRKDISTKYKMPWKLDFNTRSISTVNTMSSKSKIVANNANMQKNIIPKVPQTKRNSQMYGTFSKAEYMNK